MKTDTIKKCMICENRFSASKYHASQKYCSEHCRKESRKQIWKSKEHRRECKICFKSFIGSRYRTCCSTVCSQSLRLRNAEEGRAKAKQCRMSNPPLSSKKDQSDPHLSTEEYFYSLVNIQNEVKLRKCLRCGVKFNTRPNKRTCASCLIINSRKTV